MISQCSIGCALKQNIFKMLYEVVFGGLKYVKEPRTRWYAVSRWSYVFRKTASPCFATKNTGSFVWAGFQSRGSPAVSEFTMTSPLVHIRPPWLYFLCLFSRLKIYRQPAAMTRHSWQQMMASNKYLVMGNDRWNSLPSQKWQVQFRRIQLDVFPQCDFCSEIISPYSWK